MELVNRTLDDYTQQLIQLMPVGKLWESALGFGKNLKAVLEVIANELLKVDSRIIDLVDELTLHKPNQLVPRFERILGLPDPCVGVLPTLQQRISAIIGHLFLLSYKRGSLSDQFYIDLAARHGYTITITLLSANNWQVNAPSLTTTFFKADISKCGDKLQVSGNDLLQCIIGRYKPAHTSVSYNYT